MNGINCYLSFTVKFIRKRINRTHLVVVLVTSRQQFRRRDGLILDTRSIRDT